MSDLGQYVYVAYVGGDEWVPLWSAGGRPETPTRRRRRRERTTRRETVKMGLFVAGGRRPETPTRRRRRERTTRREMVKMGVFVVINEVHAGRHGSSRAVGGVTVVLHDAIPYSMRFRIRLLLSPTTTAASRRRVHILVMVVGDGSTTTPILLQRLVSVVR